MSWVLGNETSKRDVEPIPDGVTYGVCRGVIDLGTHYDEKYDKDKRELVIFWEIPEYRAEFTINDEKVDLPRIVSNRYTASLGSQSNLRKDIESWRGKGFTDEELAVFDLKELVGEACQLQLITKEGKNFPYITAIMSMPKGVEPPQCEGDFWWYTMEEEGEVPDTLPKWVVDKIASANENK